MKQGMLGVLCLTVIGIVAGCRGEAVSAQQAIAEYKDVGSTADFDDNQNIYFEKESEFGGNGWPMYWLSSVGDTPTPHYEDRTNFWWVTRPSSFNSGIVGSRTIKLHHYARFRVRGDRLPSNGTLFLTLRYKDDVPGPAPVFSWNGNDWTQLGTIGGRRDHQWKTQQLPVPATARAADAYTYVFKIGLDLYNRSLTAELPLDRIKLATTRARSEFPADAPGLWPTAARSKFSNIGSTMEFIPGQGPFFPFGVYDGTWITEGGTATKAGTGRRDSWKIIKDAGLNCYVLHGWEQNWGSQWKTFPNEETTQWAKPAVLVQPGLREHLDQAAAHGLKVIPNFLTDTRGYWIKNTYGTEARALQAVGNVMARYANDPNVLMWYPVDEWDHEDDAYGKPHLYSHLLYQVARQKAPNRPNFLLNMGFLGTDVWRLTAEEADVLGVDVYPGEGGIEEALKVQGERLDHIRSVVGQTKPYILVPELWQEGRTPLNPQAVIAQSYIAFIHGARGILYFRAPHPSDPRYPPRLWDGVKQVSRELFGPEGIARLMLPPSRPVDLVGTAKIVTSSNPDIHASLFEDAQGRRTLIALNLKTSSQPGVRFTITGLGNRTITTRFESGRRLTAQNNSFTDTFGALQRHVYDLGPVR